MRWAVAFAPVVAVAQGMQRRQASELEVFLDMVSMLASIPPHPKYMLASLVEYEKGNAVYGLLASPAHSQVLTNFISILSQPPSTTHSRMVK